MLQHRLHTSASCSPCSSPAASAAAMPPCAPRAAGGRLAMRRAPQVLGPSRFVALYASQQGKEAQLTAQQRLNNPNGTMSMGASLDASVDGSMDRSISASMDYDYLWNRNPSCQFGGVAEIMRTNDRGVLTCSPDDTLESIIPSLTKVTGMPVINANNDLVGVISRKDIIKVRKANGNMQARVAAHMTTPAISMPMTATVQEAAELMLSKKIRRLPIVDADGHPVGIVARSDIFKPLFADQYIDFMSKELAALKGEVGQAAKQGKKKINWRVKYLYDGDCAMCQSLKTVLERQDKGRNHIRFVNIADDDYNPKKNMGITYEDAMETIHAIKPSGEVVMGTNALKLLFDEVGMGWATQMADFPLLNWLVDVLYNFLSKNRISLGGMMDSIIVAKRMELSKAGKETCGDMDDECMVEW